MTNISTKCQLTTWCHSSNSHDVLWFLIISTVCSFICLIYLSICWCIGLKHCYSTAQEFGFWNSKAWPQSRPLHRSFRDPAELAASRCVSTCGVLALQTVFIQRLWAFQSQAICYFAWTKKLFQVGHLSCFDLFSASFSVGLFDFRFPGFPGPVQRKDSRLQPWSHNFCQSKWRWACPQEKQFLLWNKKHLLAIYVKTTNHFGEGARCNLFGVSTAPLLRILPRLLHLILLSTRAVGNKQELTVVLFSNRFSLFAPKLHPFFEWRKKRSFGFDIWNI